MAWNIQRRRAASLLALVSIAGCAGAPSTAPQSLAATPVLDSGTLEQAPYRVDIPENWNGDLVMLLHGYEPRGVPRATPWPQNEATGAFLTQGYAVAQSGYASQGWAVADAVPDNERLRAYFARRYGKPKRTYLAGFSLGGHVAIASLEQHGSHYQGAISMCGVNAPAARVFEDALTAVVAFDYFFPGAFPSGLSDMNAPSADQMSVIAMIEAALAGNEASAELLAQRLELPRPALAPLLSLQDLVLREMHQRAGGLPVDNRATVYSGFGDDVAFNKGVRRYAGDSSAMSQFGKDLSGRISKPLVLQYNTFDPTVPARYHHAYAALAKTAGSAGAPLVLPPVDSGHCEFSPEQIQAAFGALTKLVDSGQRPEGS